MVQRENEYVINYWLNSLSLNLKKKCGSELEFTQKQKSLI